MTARQPTEPLEAIGAEVSKGGISGQVIWLRRWHWAGSEVPCHPTAHRRRYRRS